MCKQYDTAVRADNPLDMGSLISDVFGDFTDAFLVEGPSRGQVRFMFGSGEADFSFFDSSQSFSEVTIDDPYGTIIATGDFRNPCKDLNFGDTDSKSKFCGRIVRGA